MRVHFKEKIFGPSTPNRRNTVYSTSGRRFRKGSVMELDESYRDWLESIGDKYYEILGDDAPVRARALPPTSASPLQTLAEADVARTALLNEQAAMLRKTVGHEEEVSRDTISEEERAAEIKAKRLENLAKARKAKADGKKPQNGKKTSAELRKEVLGG